MNMEMLRKELSSKVADTFAEGSVIRWKSADRYTYAALKAGGAWWLTNGNAGWYGSTRKSFDELLDILRLAEVSDIAVADASAFEAVVTTES